MKKTINLQAWLIFAAVFTASMGFARDYIIYSIAQDLPMGDGKEIKKNFYLNFGTNQGIQQGTNVDVYRSISRFDPYDSKKRYEYSVKVGQLKVIHSETESSISVFKSFQEGKEAPYFDIDGLMIGDKVKVSVEN